MFVCCSVAILYIVLPVVQGQANCSSFLHIPLLARSQSEREEDRCGNCTSESYLCPPWYKPTEGGSCKFGAQVRDAVTGIASTMQTQLQYLYCMTSSNVSSSEMPSKNLKVKAKLSDLRVREKKTDVTTVQVSRISVHRGTNLLKEDLASLGHKLEMLLLVLLVLCKHNCSTCIV